MWFSSWLTNRSPSQAGTRGRTLSAPRKRSTFRPRLEALEDRWLPSTLTVINNLDSGHGSLRDEIAHAKPNDTIVFAPRLDGQTITLTSGELDITKGLTIDGPGAGHLTISGHGGRVFEVNASAPVVLSGLTISDGTADNSPLPPPFQHAGGGGGILNLSTLTLSGCTVSNNHATADIATAYGGGIYNAGTLTITNSTLSNNFTSPYSGYGEGGGIYNAGTLTITNSTLSNNSSSNYGYGGYGGAIYNAYNAGTITITNSTLSYNSATDGGAIYNTNNAGALTVTSCTFHSNSPNHILGPYTDGGGNSFS
jgi:hypothetical protein